MIMDVWEFYEYVSADGKAPVSEWYNALSKKNQARADKFMRIAPQLQRLDKNKCFLPYKNKEDLLEARWSGVDNVPHRIFCYIPSGSGRRVTFLCGCTHKGKRYIPEGHTTRRDAAAKNSMKGERQHVNSISKVWQKLQDKEYRDAYTEAQLSIEIPFQIRALRKARGWTQAELAKHCGMKQSQISYIEQAGRVSPSALRTLYRLSSAFDIGLLVQFVPFSELVLREATFDPKTFNVPSFGDDKVGKISGSTDIMRTKKLLTTTLQSSTLGKAVIWRPQPQSSADLRTPALLWDLAHSGTLRQSEGLIRQPGKKLVESYYLDKSDTAETSVERINYGNQADIAA